MSILYRQLNVLGILGAVSVLSAGILVACGDNGNANARRLVKPHLVELGMVRRAPVQYAAERAGSLRALHQAGAGGPV